MSSPQYFAKADLDTLLRELEQRGYAVVGPQLRDQAIVYDRLRESSQLPRGVRDVQQPGRYRLEPTESDQYFEFNVGPHSWKQFLFPPRHTLLTARKEAEGWRFEANETEPPKYALLGVRACELAAIAVQDRIFLEGPYVDPVYAERRAALCIIAVNCTVAASTCFCTSMDTGPECQSGFDLGLTELPDGFVATAGSGLGNSLLSQLPTRPATNEELGAAADLRQRAADQITKHFPAEGVREDLLGNLDHPHWDDVATRCLSCTNCTMVCPTCFCNTVEEVSDLTGDQVERVRQWDSCFNFDFSYTAGGVVRDDRRSRFRQWLIHKLATWHDQFESSGCVGCGRCITWCPVGIDLTEEVAALRQTPQQPRQLRPFPAASDLPPADAPNRHGHDD
jgi:formate hydrogenlyase subunit 6/NADH:ubiquinone oxidoreductase subunit I